MSTQTRDRIVVAMAELMRTQGYHATSVKQVVTASGAPMGSLYHHFPEGKRQIAAAALRHSGEAYAQLLPMLMDPHEDLRHGVSEAFAAAAEDIARTGWANMCPIATIAGEVADADPELHAVVVEVLDSWIVRGIEYFRRRGLTEAAARELALALLSALEGAFVLSRTLRSAEPLHAAGRAVDGHLRGLLESSEAR